VSEFQSDPASGSDWEWASRTIPESALPSEQKLAMLTAWDRVLESGSGWAQASELEPE
jgi:hypothetical protein